MAELTPTQEAAIAAAVQQAYAVWLPAASAAVLGGYQRYGINPDPAAITTTSQVWQQQILQLQQQQLEPVAEASYDEEDPDGEFTATDALMIAAAAATLLFLMAQIGEVQSALVGIIAASATSAIAAVSIAAYLDPTNSHWTAKAAQVAMTEGDRWAQAATLSGARRAYQRDGILREKIWQTRRDNLVRDAHADVQGRRVRLYEPFIVAGFPMQYPHDPAAPPDLVVNCVPGNSSIVARDISRAIRSFYSGKVVTLFGEQGEFFTATPNHPVLTIRGWVPLKEVNKGDHLIRAFRRDAFAETYPDIKRNMATAEEVYDSLARTGRCDRVESLAVNLHGDFIDGDVDVVSTDWPLSIDLSAATDEETNQLAFACADAPIAAGGPQFHLAVASSLPPHGGVSFQDLVAALLGSHPTPFDGLRLGSGTQRNVVAAQASGDHFTADAESFAEAINGFSLLVGLQEVVDIGFDDFAGHVYSFETSSGIYMADQIVSHNCRCWLRIVKRGA